VKLVCRRFVDALIEQRQVRVCFVGRPRARPRQIIERLE